MDAISATSMNSIGLRSLRQDTTPVTQQQDPVLIHSWSTRNLSMPFLSIEVLAAIGWTPKKELIDSGVSLWLLG